MQHNSESLPARSLAAFGPYVEERTGSRVLLQNRQAKESHEVFLARDKRNKDLVLIHRLTIDSGAKEEARQSVVTTARVAMKFGHRTVLSLVEVMGVADSLVFVQQFPGGMLLLNSVERHGPVPVREALEAMHDFAEALVVAQTMRLTLSQISPQDFILSNPSGGDDSRLLCLCPPVPEGWWLEVDDPDFASPEQKRGQVCDGRSSLYSAGAVLAFMLTGTRRVEGETWQAWVDRKDWQKEVKAALLAVLQEDPANRCAAPAVWVEGLDRAIKALTPAKPRTIAPTVPLSVPSAPPRVEFRPSIPVPKDVDYTSRGKKVAVLLLVTIIAVAVLIWKYRPSSVTSRSGRNIPEGISTKPLISRTELPAVTSEPESLPPPAPIVRAPVGVIAEARLEKGPQPPIQGSPPGAFLPKAEAATSEMARRAVGTPTEQTLLDEARGAEPARQIALYRQILKTMPNHRDALHGLIEHALTDLPKDPKEREELRGWTATLQSASDPFGSYARGRLLLQTAEEATDLRTASRALTQAVESLDRATSLGYDRAWFLLLQAYVNLHNVQQQAGNRLQADKASHALFAKIEVLPKNVSMHDARLLAERLQQLLHRRATQGNPHPQATFLQRVIQRLHAVASEPGGNVSGTSLRRRDALGDEGSKGHLLSGAD